MDSFNNDDVLGQYVPALVIALVKGQDEETVTDTLTDWVESAPEAIRPIGASIRVGREDGKVRTLSDCLDTLAGEAREALNEALLSGSREFETVKH